MVQDSGQVSGRERGPWRFAHEILGIIRAPPLYLQPWDMGTRSGPTKLPAVHREAIIRSGALPSSTQCSRR